MAITHSLRAAAFCALGATIVAQDVPEFGTIAWQRDYEDATRAAKKASKPLLLLFQEVPG